jgi:DNA-binding CsgD family transcriptional regulator
MNEAQYDQIIESLYDAALTPDLWPATLQDLSSAFGAAAVSIVPLDDPLAVVVSDELAGARDEYVKDEWWQVDSMMPMLRQMASREFAYASLHYPSSEHTARDPFYQEFRKPNGMGNAISFLGRFTSGEVVATSFHLRSDRDDPGQFDRALLTSIARHCVKAMELTVRASHAFSATSTISELAELCDVPLAVLDSRMKVVLASRPLEELLGDGLIIAGGRLRATRTADQASLEGMLRGAMGSSTDRQARASDVIAISRRASDVPLLLRAYRLSPRAEDYNDLRTKWRVRALVVVIDPDRPSRQSPEDALKALGLTTGEARMAAFVGQGRSPREASDAFAVTEGTARVVLKRVFAKLHLSRQPELVRLVGKLSMLDPR